MGLWRRFKLALESGVNQKVTRIGLLFTLSCILVALAAFSSANNLLFLILAAMLATLMISGLVSRLSLSGLALEILMPEHICAGRKLIGRVIVRNEKRWMSSFSIHLAGYGQNTMASALYFAVIPGGVTVDKPVEFYFERRGSYKENSFRFSTRFPFGFAERRHNIVLTREVLVYPSIDPQPGFEDLYITLSGDIESYFRGLGTDFYRIRPYEALESARHVDWKATAHTGNLQVREFAREQEMSVEFFLDLDTEDLAWFESSIQCCAYLLWTLAMKGTRIRLCTQRQDLRIPEEGDVYTILRYLATVLPSRGKLRPSFHERNAFQIVFSHAPERLIESGWDLSRGTLRVVDAEAFAGQVQLQK